MLRIKIDIEWRTRFSNLLWEGFIHNCGNIQRVFMIEKQSDAYELKCDIFLAEVDDAYYCKTLESAKRKAKWIWRKFITDFIISK